MFLFGENKTGSLGDMVLHTQLLKEGFSQIWAVLDLFSARSVLSP